MRACGQVRESRTGNGGGMRGGRKARQASEIEEEGSGMVGLKKRGRCAAWTAPPRSRPVQQCARAGRQARPVVAQLSSERRRRVRHVRQLGYSTVLPRSYHGVSLLDVVCNAEAIRVVASERPPTSTAPRRFAARRGAGMDPAQNAAHMCSLGTEASDHSLPCPWFLREPCVT
ncbi:hypothetical protein PR202_ga26175 [Eleusine coracana subsp. coracana]|uniref:Uncharacterized protein n=1 Tax=Eleusine coracana subsp. coracana TaxID=191504 RepID=A0AAV5DDA5_ELECO|nr:hypothetical protein PR202_ga26175 [Eleusine coracana subsp. coracana]